MKFSIIVPTRNRPALFLKFLQCWEQHTSNINEIEVLAIMDCDQVYNLKLPPWVRTIVRKQAKAMCDLYNDAVPLAQGSWLLAANDDGHIQTPGWDTLAWQALEPFNGVGLGTSRQDFASEWSEFPFIGKRGAEQLGWMMPPYYRAWGADRYVHQVYSQAGRTVATGLVFSHNRPRDENWHRMDRLTGVEPKINPSRDVQRLRAICAQLE